MADGIKKSPTMDPMADFYSVFYYEDLYTLYSVCTIVEDGHITGFYRVRKESDK